MTPAHQKKKPLRPAPQELLQNTSSKKVPALYMAPAAARNSPLPLSAKQARVLAALATASEWIDREALDRIAGASNSPDVVMRLRGKLGQDCIETRQVDATDRDGKPCRPGQYRLTPAGRCRLPQPWGAQP